MATKTKIEEDGTIRSFTDWVKADGSTEFQPEAGRYHLYVQYLCPFALRAMLGRTLKGLEQAVTMDNLDWELEDGELGWKFNSEKEGCDADSQCGATYLREIYDMSAKKMGAKGFVGKTTVPTLYDRKLGRVVSTESADILRMFCCEFNEFCATEEQKQLDLYPANLKGEIDEVEAWTLRDIIFSTDAPRYATSQEAYDKSVERLYGGLDRAESLLSKQRFLVGNAFTEADVRLFCVLIRFDCVSVQHFNARKRLVDYPALWGYVRDLYQMPHVKENIHFDQIMMGVFSNYKVKPYNPYGIIPARPDLDYDAPSGRERLH